MNKKKWLIGIDEAGRGPLAGPVAVGIVVVPDNFAWSLIPGVGDSKKVSPTKREAVFGRAKGLKKEGKLNFVVMTASAKEIDEKGISVVIRNLIAKGLKKLNVKPESCFVKLDGALRAPVQFPQETIIKGDSKELVIGLASICAKETRDEYMRQMAPQFPAYQFAIHKGYGTKSHRRSIAQNGFTPEHRTTYCQNRHLWSKL
ncbi:MAG: ribonuclease HII [Patescibacteria group bacterium]